MNLVYPLQSNEILIHNRYQVYYRDVPFNLKLQYNKYKNYFTHRFLEFYADLPKGEQDLRDHYYDLFSNDLFFIGEGSEGRVLKIDNGDSLCIKEYSVELMSEKQEIIKSIPQTKYMASWYAMCRDFRVMECIEGQTLEEILKEQSHITLSLTESLKDLIDFVLSLAVEGKYINDLNIFNIMQRKDGSFTIVDYDNCSTDFFQFPVFLQNNGLSHLARYFYQTLEDLNINKSDCIVSDLDCDFDPESDNENWYEKYREKYSKYGYKSKEPKLGEYCHLDFF